MVLLLCGQHAQGRQVSDAASRIPLHSQAWACHGLLCDICQPLLHRPPTPDGRFCSTEGMLGAIHGGQMIQDMVCSPALPRRFLQLMAIRVSLQLMLCEMNFTSAQDVDDRIALCHVKRLSPFLPAEIRVVLMHHDW